MRSLLCLVLFKNVDYFYRLHACLGKGCQSNPSSHHQSTHPFKQHKTKTNHAAPIPTPSASGFCRRCRTCRGSMPCCKRWAGPFQVCRCVCICVCNIYLIYVCSIYLCLLVCSCPMPNDTPIHPIHHTITHTLTGQLKALLAVRIAEEFHGTDNEVQQLRQGLGACVDLFFGGGVYIVCRYVRVCLCMCLFLSVRVVCVHVCLMRPFPRPTS